MSRAGVSLSDGRARGALLLGALLFSTGGAAIKALPIDGFALAGMRSGVAAVFLLLVAPAARRGLSPRVLAVGVAYAATLTLFVLANKQTTAASAILLQSTAPLYLLLLGPLVLGERVTGRERLLFLAVLLGIVACFLDVIDPSATAPNPTLGNLYGASAGLCWAVTVLGLRWAVSAGRDAGLASVLVGNAFVALVALPLSGHVAWESLGALDYALVAWLGVFQIGVAYLCVTAGLRRVAAFEASLLLLAEPVLSPVWAWLAHGEAPGPWTGVAAVLILGASLFASRREAQAPS